MKENSPQNRLVEIEKVLRDISEKYKGILDECESIGYHKAWWHQKILELKNLVKDFIHQTKIAEPKLPPSYYMGLNDFIRSTEARDLIEKLGEDVFRSSLVGYSDGDIGIHSQLLLGLRAPLKDFELIIDWYRSGDKADSGDVQPATLESEGQREIENRSIPTSESGPTKDDPRRWLIRLPKDELKALLEKRISEGEDIKSSFEPRPLPSQTTIEGPKLSTRPPFPLLPKQRAKRSGMPKAPEIGAKPKPKYWQFMRPSSVSAWQAEFSPWDNLNFTILQRGYCSREAYRDYLPNLKVSRVRLYPATKKLGLGDIMTEWLNSFIQAYNEKITQIKRYLHELEYYEFEADIGIRQGEKYHPAGTPEKSLAPGQLPDKKEVDEIDEMAESPQEHPGAENVFNEDKIKFKGRLISGLSWTQGFEFIRMCLSKPNVSISVIDMMASYRNEDSHSKKIYDAEENAEERKSAIAERLMEIKKLRDPDQYKEKPVNPEELNEEVRVLENEYDNICYPDGRLKPEYDSTESYRKMVQRAVKQARKKLETRDREIAKHLKKHLPTGRYCRYSGDIKWQT